MTNLTAVQEETMTGEQDSMFYTNEIVFRGVESLGLNDIKARLRVDIDSKLKEKDVRRLASNLLDQAKELNKDLTNYTRYVLGEISKEELIKRCGVV